MITVINDRDRAFHSNGKTGFTAAVLFTGSVSNLPVEGYSNADVAYCFSGDDKGKIFIFDEDNSEWVEQEL